MPNIIGDAVITVGADGQLFVKELEKKTKPVAKKSGLNVAAAFGKSLSTGAKIAGAAAAGVIAASLAKGFSRLKAIDDAKGKLVGLGYSAQQVTTIMKSALDSVKGTAFGLGDAASSAATLVASGIKPGQDLTRTLKLLADTTTIAGTSLTDIGSIFVKVAANGKVTGEVIGQLQDRGVPVLQFLAKQTGMSMGEVIKAVSAGKISFATFQDAMEKGLGGAALASGKTFTGALANVGAALGRLGALFLGGVFEKMPAVFGGAIDALDQLAPVVERVGQFVGEQFTNALGVVKLFMEGLAGKGPLEGFSGAVNTLGLGLRALVQSFMDADVTSNGFVGVMEVLGSTLRTLWDAGMQVLDYMRQHQALAAALAISMGTLLTITQAHATFLSVQAAGGLVKYITQINAVQTATKVWAAVQWVLNSALLASPVTWIVAGIAALIAAVVLAWKNSETFRKIVTTAWEGVQKAIDAVVSFVTGSVVPWFVKAGSTIADGAKATKNALTTAWNAVWDVLKAVGSWLNSTLGPWFKTFQKTIEFVFKAIQILILAWWKLYVMPIFNLVVAILGFVGDKFSWLYNKGIKPMMDRAAAIIKTDMDIAKAIFDTVISILGKVGGWFVSLYDKYVKPKMDLIGAVIKAVWDGPISTAFDALKKGVGLVGTAFGKAKDAIGVAWNALKEIAKAPIKFVIQTVLNNGLIKAFNWLSGKIGGPHIDNIPLPFAAGGVMPGYSPGKDIHKFWSPTAGALALSGGEAIMRPEFTKAMGGKAGIARLNKLARQGKLVGDFAQGGVFHSYGLGGVVDWIKNQSSSALSWVGDKASSIWQALSNPLDYIKSKMPSVPAAGVVSSYAGAVASKLLNSAVNKIKSLFSDFNEAYDSIGGPVFSKMKAWVMAHLGIPYLWGGTGPRYDCSGFTQAANAAAGIGIPRTAAQQQDFARRVISSSIKPGDLGFLGDPAHHVELYMGQGDWAQSPHTGAVSYIGQQALGGFTNFGATFSRGGVYRPLLMDRGGTLPPGASMVLNNTGGPETLVPPGSGDLNVSLFLSIDDLEKIKTIDDFIAMLESSRATARKTKRSGTVAS